MNCSTEARKGLFLFFYFYQAVFTVAFNQFGSNPIDTTSDFTTISSVLVTVKGFEQEHPFIRAEMNGFRWCRIWHQWIACDFHE